MARVALSNVLGLLTVPLLLLLYRLATDLRTTLSPQGCRMSWMHPSYHPIEEFDASWTPLANRYSLWLYRENGWQGDPRGTPVLFIPGNAGSSHQVRSIASSAALQYWESIGNVSPEFANRGVKELDFFAVEFNEDLSAFHGPTISSQVEYTSKAVSFILSIYPPNTQVIVMGHSMGGIIATSLLPSGNISAIITMSTPHLLPPARFDSRIDKIYEQNYQKLLSDPTPILSLCGGATDMMIPSESCVLPAIPEGVDVFRRSVFTSALEGSWTGVGHLEMVWCHQVRWRVARAALELGTAGNEVERGVVLDKWLRDGHAVPLLSSSEGVPSRLVLTHPETYKVMEEGKVLILDQPKKSKMYLLPMNVSVRRFVLFLSQGTIPPVGPQKSGPLRVTVYSCVNEDASGRVPACTLLPPTTLKLIPSPIVGKPFPVPEEGSDESEGVVLFEGEVWLPHVGGAPDVFIGVRVENAVGSGWIVGGWGDVDTMVHEASMADILMGGKIVAPVDPYAMRTSIRLPNLLSNALVVFKLTPLWSQKRLTCKDSLFPPLLIHSSEPPETHYYSLSKPISLHTHSSAPYIPKVHPKSSHGLTLEIYSTSSSVCPSKLASIAVSVDWWSTLGRIVTRYPTTLACWAVAVASLVVFSAWGRADSGAPMPAVSRSLTFFVSRTLPKLLPLSFAVSFLKFPPNYYMGNEGQPIFSLIAPAILLISTGVVCISWWILVLLMWPVSKIGKLIGRNHEESGVSKGIMASMGLIFVLVFLFIPWQVAYLGCWIIHLYTCASSQPQVATSEVPSSPIVSSIPLLESMDGNSFQETAPPDTTLQGRNASQHTRLNNHHHNMHILLLMTWLLPLAAPVLAVWVRTLLTAGFTTPFTGDHNFLNVAPFLVLVDFASWTPSSLFERHRYERYITVQWSLMALAVSAVLVGPRKVYFVFDVAKVAFGILVALRIGSRYWGR